MIESVRFENFKVLRDVELRGLQRLNVLVGPSGVGKTSVLEGLELLGQLGVPRNDERGYTLGRPGRVVSGSRSAERIVTTGEKMFEIRCKGPMPLRLRATLHPESEQSWEMTSFDVETSTAWINLPGTEGNTVSRFFASPELTDWGRVVRTHLDAVTLGRASIASMSATPTLQPDGAGLPTVLAHMAGAYRDDLEQIEQELARIVEITGRIRTLPIELTIWEREDIRIDNQLFPRQSERKMPGYRFEVETRANGYVAADLLSEGTLLTLGLLVVIQQPTRPRLLLIDDLDRSLHPSAQARLILNLRKLLESRPELQIIATSHSPYLLDNFQAEEVQVMTFTSEGQVAAARLDTHPEWLEWKGRLQTGEFWATVGEDWVGAKR